MARGKRSRIADGVYSDAHGLSATVKVGAIQRERRFPHGTDLLLIQRWREETRIRLRFHKPKGRGGTLAGDAERYLAQVQHLASYHARRVEVMVWVRAFGDALRETITAQQIRTARATWLQVGTAPKTCNNRVQTLRHLYRTLDGTDQPTPCDAVKPLPVPKTPPVYITADLILAVDAKLRPGTKTRARFRVYASMGKRPCEIMRAHPEDLNLDRRVWYPRDAKGGYCPGLYLNDDQLAAWQDFIAAAAWGHFDTTEFAAALRLAGWPAGVKPYNLRHTTWIEASERGADLADIQAGAGHTSIATTRRHYVPVLNSRMQRLSVMLDGRFGWATPPQSRMVPAGVPAADQRPANILRDSRNLRASQQAGPVGENRRHFFGKAGER